MRHSERYEVRNNGRCLYLRLESRHLGHQLFLDNLFPLLGRLEHFLQRFALGLLRGEILLDRLELPLGLGG